MAQGGGRAREIMQYSFLHVFANDDTIDAGELALIERLALQDGQIDAAEREVLQRIFARVSAETVEPSVWKEINAFKKRHRIP